MSQFNLFNRNRNLTSSLKTLLIKKIILIFLATVLAKGSFCQLGGFGKKLLDKATSVSLTSFLKTPDPISTSFKDVDHSNALGPDDININVSLQRSIGVLARTPNNGFVLQEGFYYYQAQSYCLKAGTQGPSKGYGYMYAPTKGPADDAVMSIARRAVNHPEVPQRDIQVLLWAIIAHAKFEDLQAQVKATAAKLLTPRQLAQLNRSALDIIPEETMSKARASVPNEVKLILDAENQLRQMLYSATGNYEDMERIAVLAADKITGNEEIKPGTWTWNPLGYYVRFLPVVYYQTRVEIYVPNGSGAAGKEFDPAMHIAAPASTGRQRLLMSGRPYSDDPNSPGFPDPVPPVVVLADAITTSLADAKWYDATKDGFEPGEGKRSMFALQRTPNGGFVMQPGYYEYAAQSFSIKAGGQVNSPGGTGYLYAPTKGPRESVVMTVLRNAVNHPEVTQAEIQELIDAIIRGSRWNEFSTGVKTTSSRLLTPRQLAELNSALPAAITAVNAVVAFNNVVPEGNWSQHPDGYFIRYKPLNAKTLQVQIWLPQGSPGVGKEFDPAKHVAVPADVTKDRIMFSGRM